MMDATACMDIPASVPSESTGRTKVERGGLVVKDIGFFSYDVATIEFNSRDSS